MAGPRLRFASLWLSQETRILAEWMLRITAWLEVASWPGQAVNYAWHLATAVFITPYILLAPFHGALSNSRPRRGVLGLGAVIGLLGVVMFLGTNGPWIAALGVAAVGAALFSPTRFAMLPAVAVDTGWPLSRVNGWIEMGTAAAIVGGILLGLQPWTGEVLGVPTVIGVVVLLSLACVLTAIPARFPSDVGRSEPAAQAVAGFFRDCRRVWEDRPSRYSLLGLASFQALVTAGTGAIVARNLGTETMGPLIAVGVGAAVGAFIASLQGHPRRVQGLVPIGVTAMLGCLLLLAFWDGSAPWLACAALGVSGGLVNVPLRSTYLAHVPADARGNATAVMNFAIYVLVTLVALLMVGLVWAGWLVKPEAQLLFLAALTTVGMILAWRYLALPLMDLFLEWLVWFPYNLRGHGPGLHRMPLSGPLLMVGNHTSYFDPFWIGKFIPRRYVPMMTSKFYDLPVVHWLMVNVIGTIRVEVGKYRREAPELKQAIDVLRRGGCVLIYPEAILRRHDTPILRQFGQGVWHILKELPETPVVVFWVEGGWGSWASYKGGPPFKGKKFDRRRPIDIAISELEVMPAEVLSHHRQTRRYLMQACLNARRYLGLEVPDLEAEAAEEPEDTPEVPAS